MLRYTIRRLLLAVLVAFLVSIATFGTLRMAGDPAAALAGEDATQADIERVREMYGFDRPIIVQYWDWAGSALTGDFGVSVYLRVPVADVILERAPVTMTLGLSGLLFALAISIPLGVVAGLRPNSAIDRIALSIAVVGQAMPSFFFGLLLIMVFGIILGVMPISGSGTWLHFVLPAIALGYYATPALMRLTRTGTIEVLASDYIRTAYAKGLSPMIVLFKHALRNAVIPVVAVSAVQLGFMLGGSVVIETVFTINGLGRLAWQSIQRSDFEMMQAIVLVIAMFYVVLTFFADLLNAFLDPRIRVH